MRGLWQNPGQDGMRLETDGWNCRVSFAGVSPEFSGWVPMDYRHSDCLEGQNRIPDSLSEEMGRGLLFEAGNDEFYLVGHKVRLFFMPAPPADGSIPASWLNGQHQAHGMEFLTLEEGHFEEGKFVCDRIRSGDEARHGVWASEDSGVVHFRLLRQERE